MNFIDKNLKNVINEGLVYGDKNLFKIGTLEDEIMDYNRRLHKIIKDKEIYFHNNVSFMLKIKEQISNRELLPLVICFLCDKNYINKFKEEALSPIAKGDIAAYVLLKTNIESFLDGIKVIQKNKTFEESYELENAQTFYKLKVFIAEIYGKCNCIYISKEREQHKILDSNDEKYIRNFIYDNLKFKTIDYKVYMKKLEIGGEEAAKYLIDITKKFLRFREEAFIKQVEHVCEFYNMLERILNEEVNKEFETIISEYIYNVVFARK